MKRTFATAALTLASFGAAVYGQAKPATPATPATPPAQEKVKKHKKHHVKKQKAAASEKKQ